MKNYKPSVVSDVNGWARIAWLTDHYGQGAPYDKLVVYWDESDSTRYTMLDYNVQSVSLNESDDPRFFFVWSRLSSGGQWANYCSEGATRVIKTTLTTAGQDVQLCYASDKANMRVSSFYPFTLPYSFITSQPLGPLFPKVDAQTSWADGRGIAISKGDLLFYYSIDGLLVDGNSIPFVAIPDSMKQVVTREPNRTFKGVDSLGFGSMLKANSVLVTEPFSLGSNSKLILRDYAGFPDSLAATKALAIGQFIGYRVDLLDASSGLVVGTLKSSTLASATAHGYRRNNTSFDTKALAGKRVKARIVISTNITNPRTAIFENRLLESDTDPLQLGKFVESLKTPTEFSLDQNYPNPFNPTTQIRYSLPSGATVFLVVYDVLGREVATLANGYLEAGCHTVAWDGSLVASGMYFARITIKDESGQTKFTKVNKLLLTK